MDMDYERSLLNCEMVKMDKNKVINLFNYKYSEIFKEVIKVDNLFVNFTDFFISGKGLDKCFKSIIVYQLNLSNKQKWKMRCAKTVFFSKKEENFAEIEIDVVH